ncbi:MAG: hypothetical protein ACOX5W_09970 [Bacillota bacterium]|jgi:hypothetical protein
MSVDARYELTDKEIIEQGITALIRELGYKGLVRFMSQFEQGLDYLIIQESLFQNMSVDDLYEASRDSLK